MVGEEEKWGLYWDRGIMNTKINRRIIKIKL